MKHVRLMIFHNWISQKAGDKVSHTPLILPINFAGPRRAPRRMMNMEGASELEARKKAQTEDLKRSCDATGTDSH